MDMPRQRWRLRARLVVRDIGLPLARALILFAKHPFPDTATRVGPIRRRRKIRDKCSKASRTLLMTIASI